MNTESIQPLTDSAVQLKNLEAWRDDPHVVEGDGRELAAPFGGDADSTQQCTDGVTEALPTVEALVRVHPHAVITVGGFWFGQHIFERNLNGGKIESNL